MLIFLDESGDAGFKLGAGSSTFFVIALVIFGSPDDAEATAETIKVLRRSMGVRQDFEFKFNKCDDSRRLRFLEAVQDAPFRVRAMVVDKREVRIGHLRADKEHFYNYFIGEVLKHNGVIIRGASLRVDGSGDRDFNRAFGSYLRGKLGPAILRNSRLVDSRSNSLIQLADMVAGAIFRSLNPDEPDDRFVRVLRSRLDDLWNFQ